MIDEILSDFFGFVSKDKFTITKDDLKRLEVTIDKPEFDEILVHLEEFINEFVFWSIRKLNISIDQLMEDNMGNKIALESAKNKSELKSQKTGNSHKQMYKKNVDIVTFKTSDFGISFRNLIKIKNFNIGITYEMLQEFYDLNNHFLNTILKFITRMQTILINERLVRKTKSSQKFKRIIPADKQSPNKKRLKGEGRRRKSISNVNLNDNGVNRNDISDCNISNISNDISAHQKSFVSDNELITQQSKVNFLKVMKGVTKNMLKEIKQTGKDIDVKLDDAVKNDLLVDNSKMNGNAERSKINYDIPRFEKENEVEMQLDESNIPNNLSQQDLDFNSNGNFIDEIENNDQNSPIRKYVNKDQLVNSKKSKRDTNMETKSRSANIDSKRDPNMDTKNNKTSDIQGYSKQIEISIQNKLSDTKNNSIKPQNATKKDTTNFSVNNALSNTLQVEQNKKTEKKKSSGGCRCLIF